MVYSGESVKIGEISKGVELKKKCFCLHYVAARIFLVEKQDSRKINATTGKQFSVNNT